MDELIECNEFQGRPSLEGKDFVDYFNLEYGTYPPEEFEGTDVKPFYEHDFKFIGFYLSKQGQQQMYFTAGAQPGLYAIGVPLINGKAMVSMTTVSPTELEEIQVG